MTGRLGRLLICVNVLAGDPFNLSTLQKRGTASKASIKILDEFARIEYTVVCDARYDRPPPHAHSSNPRFALTPIDTKDPVCYDHVIGCYCSRRELNQPANSPNQNTCWTPCFYGLHKSMSKPTISNMREEAEEKGYTTQRRFCQNPWHCRAECA